MFPVDIAKFLSTVFFTEHLPVAASHSPTTVQVP